MILSTIRMTISPPKLDEALKIFKMTAEHSRVNSGCLSCHLYMDAQEENTILFSETWRSSEDLEQHLRSDEYHKILLVLEMAEKTPELRFDTISGSTGIETVRKARMSV